MSQFIGSSENTETNSGVLQRFRSLGEHLHLLSTTFSPKNTHKNAEKKTISVSTGYLNLKDVFYNRSVTELPEYVENKERFRSVNLLYSQKDLSNLNLNTQDNKASMCFNF